MPKRDYSDVARKLRAKANDPATAKGERAELLAKAEEFEAKVGERATKIRIEAWSLYLQDYTNYRRLWPDLDDIIENGYSYDPKDYGENE